MFFESKCPQVQTCKFYFDFITDFPSVPLQSTQDTASTILRCLIHVIHCLQKYPLTLKDLRQKLKRANILPNGEWMCAQTDQHGKFKVYHGLQVSIHSSLRMTLLLVTLPPRPLSLHHFSTHQSKVSTSVWQLQWSIYNHRRGMLSGECAGWGRQAGLTNLGMKGEVEEVPSSSDKFNVLLSPEHALSSAALPPTLSANISFI